MRQFAKRALLLTIFVLCLLGLTVLAASAAGDATQDSTHVASVTNGATTEYYADLSTAISEAPTGSTVTVLKNTTFATAVTIDGKVLTIQGASADIAVTSSVAIQLNGGVSSLTIKDLTVNPSANFLTITTSDDTHTVKLENVTMNPTAAANANLIHVTNTKANIEIVNCTVKAANTNRLVTVGAGGNLVDYKVTNSDFTNINVARVEGAGVIGSASNPAQLTDLTSDKVLFYAYTGTLCVNIYGGEFTGPLVYGGDNHNNTLDIKCNPTGDKVTRFTLNSGNQYGAFVYQNPSATTNSLNFSFFNTIVSDTGGAPAIFCITSVNANITINAENSGFIGPAKTHNFTSANATVNIVVNLENDFGAIAQGYTVRVGEEGNGATYYKSLDEALLAIPADDGNGGATTIYVIANTKHSSVGNNGNTEHKFCKKVHITSVGGPHTITTGGAGSIAFFLGNGAELTFTNITLQMAGRFARIDGNCTVTFGNGTTVNHSDTIFIYDNGNSYAEGGDTDTDTDDVYVSNFAYTVDIQQGAVINATGAIATGLIYKSDTKNRATITVKIAGKINMAAKKPVYHAGTIATSILDIDRDNLDITCTADASFKQWFAGGSTDAVFLRFNDFDSIEDAVEWAYTYTNASSVTYNADPEAEWKYTLVYHGQFTHAQYNVLNSNGGEIWQIRDAGSIYQTAQFTNLGTVTLKSYNGATISFQGEAYRFRINGGTTLILDGIELKTPGAMLAVQSASSDKPATLKLINGAKITGTDVSKKVSSENIPVLVVLDGPYTNLYVDASSAITQTGEATSYGSTLIYAYGKWENGTIEINGTLTSTVTSDSQTIVLIRITSVATNVNLVFNGAVLNAAEDAFESYTIHAPNTYKGTITATEDVEFGELSGILPPAPPASDNPEVQLGELFTTLKYAIQVAQDGDIIYILRDIELDALPNITGKTITIQGKTGNEKLTLAASSSDKYMFSFGNNINVTFKSIKITTDRFVEFKQKKADASATLTLNEGAVITNASNVAANLIYNAQANGNLTININAGASVVVSSTAKISTTFGVIQSDDGTGITLNIRGTLKNLATMSSTTRSAQLFIVKGTNNNATLNVYDGAVLEGTSNSSGGIVSFSAGAGGNAINIFGGAITIQGKNVFASTGDKCLIMISGGTINHAAATNPMFSGDNQTAILSGSPVINNNGKNLLKSGVQSYAIPVSGPSDYANAIAADCFFLHIETGTAYSALAAIVNLLEEGDSATITILASSEITSEITINNKHITLIGGELAEGYHLNSTATYAFVIENMGTLTFKDLKITATKGLIQYTCAASDAIASEDRDIVINFINTRVDASGSAVSLIASKADGSGNKKCNSITLNVDKDSVINFTTSSTNDVEVFTFEHNSHPYVYININGKVNADATGSSTTKTFYLIRSSDPTATKINVSETAKITIKLNEARQTSKKSYFAYTGSGDSPDNKIYLHINAITDNGELTLGGVALYHSSSTTASRVFDIIIEANDTTTAALIYTLQVQKGNNKDWTNAIGICFETGGSYLYADGFGSILHAVPNGGTITLSESMTLDATITLINQTLTIMGATPDVELKIAPQTEMFYISDNAHVIFQNLKITADKFVVFKQNTAGASASLTLGEGVVVTNYDLAVDNTALILNSNANANVTVNILAGASVIVQSLTEVAPKYAIVHSTNGTSFTLNVWGTLKNLAQIAAGSNAEVFTVKGTNQNATLNVYEGAVIEGASNFTKNSGNYAGIVYFSEGTQNVINIYGGTITVKGVTGFAYTGNNATVNIYAGTILNEAAEYPLIFGANQVVILWGATISNNGQKLVGSGALGIQVSDNDYTFALENGCVFLYQKDSLLFTHLSAIINLIPDGETALIKIIAPATITEEIVINNKSIILVGGELAEGYHLTSTATFAFRFDNMGSLTFRNLKISATQGLIRYQGVSSTIASSERNIYITFEKTIVDANGAAAELISSVAHYGTDDKKCGRVVLTIGKNSVINFTTSATGDVKVIRYDHNTHASVFTTIYGTVNVNVTGDSDTASFYFIRSNNPSTTQITVSETAKINITLATNRQTSGKSYFTSNTGGTPASNTIYLHADAITNNGQLTLGGVKLYAAYYTTSAFEIVIEAKDNSAEAALYTLLCENGNGVAATQALALYLATETAYFYGNGLNSLMSRLPTGATATIYIFAPITITSVVNIIDQNITLVGLEISEEYHINTSKYFAIYSKGTLTFKDLNIFTSSQLIDYQANIKVEGEKADKDITVNFINTNVVARGSMSYLVASRNHYAEKNGGCGEQGDSFTFNMDADSRVEFTTDATGNVYFISFNHNPHPYAYANIHGQIEIHCKAVEMTSFHFMRTNNPSYTGLVISETAKLNIVLDAEKFAEGKFLTSYTTGGAGANTVTIHVSAITDANGALTLGGVLFTTAGQYVTAPAVHLAANDNKAYDALVNWMGKINTASNALDYYPVAFFTHNTDNNTYHYGTLFGVAPNAANGGEVIMLRDAIELGSAYVTNSFKLVPVTPGLVLKHYGGHLFRVVDSTAENPCTITIENILFEGSSTGSVFYVSGTAHGIFTMNNCNMNGTTGVISITGSAVATLTVNKGNYTVSYSPFNAAEFSNITVNLYDVTIVGKGGSNENGMFFLNNSATGTYNIKGGSVTSNWHTFYGMSSSVAYVNIEDFSIITNQWALASQSSTTWYVNLTNVNVHSNNNTTMRLYGAKGSYVNIMGGTFTCNKKDGTNKAIMTFGNSMAVNIFDAYIASPYMSVVSGLTTTVNITIYGGTFIYCGTEATYAPIMLPHQGNLTVKGGTFINQSGLGPVFSNTNYSANMLKLEAYNAINNASNLTLNYSTLEGSAPTSPIGAYGRLTLNTLMMERGARPAFVDGKLAMTFKATVDTDTVNYLKSLTGDGNIQYGMLVVPTELLAKGIDFTHAGLARYTSVFGDKLELGKDYFDVKATDSTANIVTEEDGCITLRLTFDGVADVNTKYSVVFYAKYEALAVIGENADGTPIYAQVGTTEEGSPIYSSTVYRYADYEETDNARSLAEVAYAAYNNPSENFSDAQKTQLATWANTTEEKTLDLFLMAGGSNAVGNTPYTQEYAASLANYICTHCGDIAAHNAFASDSYTCTNRLSVIHGKRLTLKNGTYYCDCGYTTTTVADPADPKCPNTVRCANKLTLKNGKYSCTCGYAYDPAVGIPEQGVPAGTTYAALNQLVADGLSLTCPELRQCGAAKADFKIVLQDTPTNVFYSGLVSQPAPQVYASTTVHATTNKYTAIGTPLNLGLGWSADTFGPEYGMGTELAKHYSGNKYAAILKYAVNDASLIAEDPYYGNFSGELYENFVQLVKDQIEDYESLGYKVNIAGLYWMQGEADIANADAYAEALQTLITNIRTDLAVEDLPIVVGEIATVINDADSANRTALLAAQNSVTGVLFDNTSKYIADENGIFLDPQDVTATGKRVAALLLNAIDESVVVPEIENVTTITDGESNVIGGHTSLAESLLTAPDGATITLKNDVTLYNTLSVLGSKNIVLQGALKEGTTDQYATITMAIDAPAFALENANVTLNNVVINHTGDAPAITLDKRSEMTVEGNTAITATATVFDLVGTATKLTIKNGTFNTVSDDAGVEDALIRTSSANVTILGGNFEAAKGTSIVLIKKFSASKLIVNVMGGTFKVTDKVTEIIDTEGNEATETVNAIAFVNECPAAILVVDPAAIVTAPSGIINNAAKQ